MGICFAQQRNIALLWWPGTWCCEISCSTCFVPCITGLHAYNVSGLGCENQHNLIEAQLDFSTHLLAARLTCWQWRKVCGDELWRRLTYLCHTVGQRAWPVGDRWSKVWNMLADDCLCAYITLPEPTTNLFSDIRCWDNMKTDYTDINRLLLWSASIWHDVRPASVISNAVFERRRPYHWMSLLCGLFIRFLSENLLYRWY